MKNLFFIYFYLSWYVNIRSDDWSNTRPWVGYEMKV